MKVKELVEKAGLTVYAGGDGLDREISGGYTSDLLSDVMGFAREGEVWITLQTHKNVIGIASLKDLAAIIFVKGFRPEADTVELASAENVPLLGSGKGAFELSAEVYNLLK